MIPGLNAWSCWTSELNNTNSCTWVTVIIGKSLKEICWYLLVCFISQNDNKSYCGAKATTLPSLQSVAVSFDETDRKKRDPLIWEPRATSQEPRATSHNVKPNLRAICDEHRKEIRNPYRIIRNVSIKVEKLHAPLLVLILMADLKVYLLHQKDGLYMLVVLASPGWRWCPGEYLLVTCGFRFCMKPANICQDTSTIWEKLIKPTYRAHLFDEVSTPLRYWTCDPNVTGLVPITLPWPWASHYTSIASPYPGVMVPSRRRWLYEFW